MHHALKYVDYLSTYLTISHRERWQNTPLDLEYKDKLKATLAVLEKEMPKESLVYLQVLLPVEYLMPFKDRLATKNIVSRFSLLDQVITGQRLFDTYGLGEATLADCEMRLDNACPELLDEYYNNEASYAIMNRIVEAVNPYTNNLRPARVNDLPWEESQS
jgi:hypothetical protein